MQSNPFKIGDKVRQKSSTMLSEVLGGLYYSDDLGQKIHIVYGVTPSCVMLDDDAEWWWERFELVPEEKVQEEVKSEEKVPTLKEKFYWGIVNDENKILDLYKTRQNARESKIFWSDSTKIKKVKLTVME